jgi:transcriptional regulator with XRE-family HTH domain
MVKPIARPYSQYSLDALALLGQRIREGRLARRMTAVDLAVRARISRTLLQRIERGDAGCAIGAVFEVAAICGVPLFEADPRALASTLTRQQEKMALLPKAVRAGGQGVKDDF